MNRYSKRQLFSAMGTIAFTVGGGYFLLGAEDSVSSTNEETASAPDTTEAVEHPSKSIGFYIGKDLTENGATILGGFGHEPSSHWIDIVPAQTHPEGATMEVGVTEDANIPGELIDIPQVTETYKYISSSYSEFAGFPPPLTNGGLNEKGVAARDIWSPSRDELVEMTPEPQQGPQYSDLARIAMERADSAQHAVEILGEIIDEHGFSTYGGNSHLFADEEEGWVFINYAGGEGLWAAERLGSDEIRVSYPGYIHDFPVDFENDDDFMASDNIISLAEEQGWWEPEEDDTHMNLQDVYGLPFPGEGVDYEEDHYTATRIPTDLEEELEARGTISLEDMLAQVRDPRWSNDYAGYGQVAELREDIPNELQTLWTATTGAVTTPYVPIPIAAEEVPPEFLQHRYLTKESDSAFLDPEYQHIEATRSAVHEFKRLMYFTCERPQDFLHEVTGEMEGFEMEMLAERESLEAEAADLLNDGKEEEAAALITENVNERLTESLELGMELTDRVEQATREDGGIRLPETEEIEGSTIPAASQPMTGGQVTCYDPELDEYPRDFGIYTDEAEKTSDGDIFDEEFGKTELERFITEGVVESDDTLKPDQPVTREETAVILANAFGLKTDRSVNKEELKMDVSEGSYEAIAAVIDANWMTYDENGFRPEDYVNRAEMAVILQQAFDLGAGHVNLKDVEEHHWAYDSIAALAEAGMAGDYLEDAFHPAAHTTFGQLAVFLDRGFSDADIIEK